MKLSFKRIISSGSFIPEIDGLRFIAITSVVLFHLADFLILKDKNIYSDSIIDFSLFKRILSHGHLGVPLFFVISGFILGMPFAKFYIGNGDKISLKKYFLRRITRLEPPYIIVMTAMLIGAVYLTKTRSFDVGMLSYLSSITYTHNFIYGVPVLNPPVWSLEIEIQFYILAPLMASIFCIKNSSYRHLFLICTALLFLIISQFNPLPFKSIVGFMHYFLVGFLLADLYVSKSENIIKSKYDFFIGLFFFIIIWIFDVSDFEFYYQKLLWEIFQLMSIFILYYYVLFHKIFKFLSLKLITNIGGMCYSIYLLHWPILYIVGNYFLKFSFSENSILNTLIYSIFILSVLMILSSIFFLLVERPCMEKDWYKKIFKSKK